MYTILRVRNFGNVCWICTDDEKQAKCYYYIACMFNVYEDSFIALFYGHVMIRNNQEAGKF
jgi:hypothetical protein